MAETKTHGAGLRQLQAYPSALQFVSQLAPVDLNKVAAIAVQIKALMDAGAMSSIEASEEACSVFDNLHGVVDNLLVLPSTEAKAVRGSVSEIKTKPKQFFACNPTGGELFTVSAGIPVLDALESVSCIFNISRQLADNAAERFDNEVLWALSYQIEMGKAVLDSMIEALVEEVSHG